MRLRSSASTHGGGGATPTPQEEGAYQLLRTQSVERSETRPEEAGMQVCRVPEPLPKAKAQSRRPSTKSAQQGARWQGAR
eukprot:1399594-Lingulodinium_polyedra.AAC.1